MQSNEISPTSWRPIVWTEHVNANPARWDRIDWRTVHPGQVNPSCPVSHRVLEPKTWALRSVKFLAR